MSHRQGPPETLGDRISRLEQNVSKILKAIDPVGDGKGFKLIEKGSRYVAELESIVMRAKNGMDEVIRLNGKIMCEMLKIRLILRSMV